MPLEKKNKPNICYVNRIKSNTHNFADSAESNFLEVSRKKSVFCMHKKKLLKISFE